MLVMFWCQTPLDVLWIPWFKWQIVRQVCSFIVVVADQCICSRDRAPSGFWNFDSCSLSQYLKSHDDPKGKMDVSTMFHVSPHNTL